MMADHTGPDPGTVTQSLRIIATEHRRVLAHLCEPDGLTTSAGLAALAASAATAADQTFAAAVLLVQSAPRVFVFGAGRSGLALKMVAMRLMHLGLTVHVVGEVTTPAVASDDLLLVASGSGTTAGVIAAATTARGVGAKVLAITTAPASALAELADVLLIIPAATKQDHGGVLSAQYSGSLFEQLLLLYGDALFHSLWEASGETAEALWPRHANVE